MLLLLVSQSEVLASSRLLKYLHLDHLSLPTISNSGATFKVVFLFCHGRARIGRESGILGVSLTFPAPRVIALDNNYGEPVFPLMFTYVLVSHPDDYRQRI